MILKIEIMRMFLWFLLGFSLAHFGLPFYSLGFWVILTIVLLISFLDIREKEMKIK
jgi:hypothetical protein